MGTAEERISELEAISIETSKTKAKRTKTKKKKYKQGPWDNSKKVYHVK